MKVHLIGSNGFIGKAIQAVPGKHQLICWSHSTRAQNYFDLLDPNTWSALLNRSPETVLFLSWPSLPNYNNLAHLLDNLSPAINFFESLINSGCKNIIVSGTCYEYGLQNGALSEATHYSSPQNYYAISKDSLRLTLSKMCEINDVRMVWLRIFFPYGLNQNPHSIYPSLITAIKRGDSEFRISSGRQIRDFIMVEEIARQIILLTLDKRASGLFNCASGSPISILEWVERIIHVNQSSIEVVRGYYSDRLDEPTAFWADMTKFKSLFPNYNLKFF